jgi:archaellum component FlaF (FlaF/FlaG flagellin family)
LDKTIITGLLIIAGVITAVLLYNAVYPAVIQSSDALTGRQRRIDERLNSQIEIIHVAPWGVSNVKTVYVWVKNIGSSRVEAIEYCDVFFGPEGNFSRIPYSTGDPHWTYQVENDTEWNPTATLKITIDYTGETLTSSRYFVKVTLPSGVSDEYYFSF